MLERMACGRLPPKHHLALRAEDGTLHYEECLTRDGFEGPYTILYHRTRPQALQARAGSALNLAPNPESPAHSILERRHFWTERVAQSDLHAGRATLLYSEDLSIGISRPIQSDSHYSINADADELYFVRRGRGLLRCPLGDLAFGPLDYVYVPKGLLHRFEHHAGSSPEFLGIECRKGLGIPAQFRNAAGQLRMDAPYCHRDFRRPEFKGPLDEGLRELVIKRDDKQHLFRLEDSPFDVVGWDGTVYPWAFPILAFQPRVSSVHLPPTWHGTFAAGGALICSFVPRPLEFHPQAIPCPYPHSSVDIDEVLYYVSGEFTSREGVGPGSLTLHPRGVPHGPQPGKYEGSLGATRTEELAVMLDCRAPLRVSAVAAAAEDPHYERSFASE